MIVEIHTEGPDTLIYKEEIIELIISELDTMTGKPLDNINLEAIEELLAKNHFIYNSDASITVSGVLKISASQRQPVLRLATPAQSSVYIDEKGVFFPVKQGFPSYTPLLLFQNGSQIKSIKPGESIDVIENSILEKALLLGKFIQNDDFLRALIDQIIITKHEEFELVPKIPGHTIMLGISDDMEIKFRDLLWIYKKVLPEKGWDYYKVINLKYDNQVVCSK
jgi:cell division protein FtsQ